MKFPDGSTFLPTFTGQYHGICPWKKALQETHSQLPAFRLHSESNCSSSNNWNDRNQVKLEEHTWVASTFKASETHLCYSKHLPKPLLLNSVNSLYYGHLSFLFHVNTHLRWIYLQHTYTAVALPMGSTCCFKLVPLKRTPLKDGQSYGHPCIVSALSFNT